MHSHWDGDSKHLNYRHLPPDLELQRTEELGMQPFSIALHDDLEVEAEEEAESSRPILWHRVFGSVPKPFPIFYVKDLFGPSYRTSE